MRKTYLYQTKINKTTEANCNQWLEICRTLYNLALEQRISIYKQHGKSISLYQQMSQLPELKQSFPEFKTVGSQCLQDVLQRLDKAFKGFYQRLKERHSKAGFPRFKSKNRYDSFTLKQSGWRLEGRCLYIKNVGRFKLFLSRPIEGDIKTVTIRRTSTGKWFIAFSCDNVPVKKLSDTPAEIGIDVGIKSFCLDSEANQIQNPKHLEKSLKLLRRRQRSLSRKKKGSRRRNKARILVAKAHEKVVNQRKDFLHKVANLYIKAYNTIYVEDLNIKGMIRNRYLSRSIADSSWGMFFNLLSYKAAEAGRTVVKVTPNGTSQICSGCGEKVPKSLSVRVHQCPFCKLVLDRDHNASLNILRLGQSLPALSTERVFA
ncbi:putative transposase [Candidatus Hakubella thermalkaliphila]|uniref:Putative transposase n=1 Tax=Candidatus Hakubella thermalkaliphila TaxID=2754717 RepID=A0A6V8PNP1_9ACTN|nr:RNA-guided endonuclease TnpB family protein [Candidatus Hakubella thermalkaliphila]GFP24634.1 putative transposase [Candidatus Hakubella thermalkaliphila]GFP27513.1 putative transposase [Candidatus Hakubella thermalkaliphila]GFP34255.1 putative transposase [Candidatus Hakubella thermalkaliphila]